jgi:transcription-repair coupling factor (superfamily II helicase)
MDIMRLKIMARYLLITKINDMQGKIRVIFSPHTKVGPKDIFELQKKSDLKIKFLPDGFEVDLKGFSWEQAYKKLSYLFTCLFFSDNFNENSEHTIVL